LIDIVRTSKKKEIEGIPEGVEDFCDAMNVPKNVIPHMNNKTRRHLDAIEEAEGVMIFLFKAPGFDDDDNVDDEPDGFRAFFIFAYDPTSRQRAMLRIERAVAEYCPGFGRRDPENPEIGFNESII
jgi:hypothetical protein